MLIGAGIPRLQVAPAEGPWCLSHYPRLGQDAWWAWLSLGLIGQWLYTSVHQVEPALAEVLDLMRGTRS